MSEAGDNLLAAARQMVGWSDQLVSDLATTLAERNGFAGRVNSLTAENAGLKLEIERLTRPPTPPVEPPPIEPPHVTPPPATQLVLARVGQPVFFRPDAGAVGGTLPYGFARFEAPGMLPLEGPIAAFVWYQPGFKTVSVTPGPDVRVQVVADDRPIVRTSGDNLEALWLGAKPDTIIEASGEQTVRSRAVLTARNVTLRQTPAGAAPLLVNVAAGRNQYFGLSTSAPGTTIEGARFTTDYTGSDKGGCPAHGVEFLPGSDGGMVTRCTFDGVEDGVRLRPGAARVLFQDCQSTARTRGYGILIHAASDVVRSGGTWRAVNEHPIRFMGSVTKNADGRVTAMLPPMRATIAHGRCERTVTASKEALTVRAGEDVSIHDEALVNGFGGRLGIAAGDGQLPSPAVKRVMLRRVHFERCALWIWGSGNGIDGVDYDALTFTRPGMVNDVKSFEPKPPVNVASPTTLIRNIAAGTIEVK